MVEEIQPETPNKVVDKKIIIILILLFLVAVALVVGIVLRNNKSSDTTVIDGASQALDIVDEIDEKLENGEYVTDEAIERYEQEMETGDTTKRIKIAYYYAYFILEANEDLDSAIEIMERIKPLIENQADEIPYYETLRDLCFDANNTEKVTYYEKIISDLLGEEDS